MSGENPCFPDCIHAIDSQFRVMVTSQAGVDAVSVVTEVKPSNCGLTREKNLNINRNIEIFFILLFDINC